MSSNPQTKKDTYYMSAKIFTQDRVMAVTDKPTWHGLENAWMDDGEKIQVITRENSKIVLGGKIVRCPLFHQPLITHEESGQIQFKTSGEMVPVIMSADADKYWNESEEQDRPCLLVEVWNDADGSQQVTPLCIASESFQVQDPDFFWSIVENAFAEIPYRVTCVGTHSNRRKIWLSLELIEKENFIAGGEKFAAHVNIMEGRDKTQRFVIVSSMIRVVCANTFQWTVQEAHALIAKAGMEKVRAGLVKTDNGFVGKAKHTVNFADYIKAIEKDLPVLMATPDAFAKVYDKQLIKRKVSKEQIRKILLGMYAIKTKVKGSDLPSTRTLNQINGIETLVHTGKGNVGKTMADVWNGITEYYTSGDGSGSKDPVKKFQNSEFGTGSRIKTDSFWNLIEDAEIERMEKEGQRLLDLAAKHQIDLMVAV